MGVAACMSDAEALERTAKNTQSNAHPSLLVHQLLSGIAKHQGREADDFTDPSLMAWGERNHGLVCGSLADMIAMQEAACFSDVLASSGEPRLGLEYWARNANARGAPGLRDDYAAYASPWPLGTDREASVAAVHSSFVTMRPWLGRAKQRIAGVQDAAQTIQAPVKSRIVKRRPAAAKASAKRAPRSKAAQA